jgi:hypothetical protein
MPAGNEINQSIRLALALDPPFPLGLTVRTPEHLRRDLEGSVGMGEQCQFSYASIAS